MLDYQNGESHQLHESANYAEGPAIPHQRRPEELDAALGVERIGPDDPRFALAEELEYEVFRMAGYVNEDRPERRLTEYDNYRGASTFNVINSPQGKMEAVLREISPSVDGFKTVTDFRDKLYPLYRQQLDQTDPSKIREIGTVAALPEARKNRDAHYMDRLYAAAYGHARADGVTTWVASIDAGVLAAFRHRYGFQFTDIGDTDPDYIGSPTTPVALNLEEQAEYYRTERPDLYNTLIEGKFGAQEEKQ